MNETAHGRGYRPLCWAIALAGLALWSCSTPEERYHTLSLFFDGVPLPESMRSEESGGPGGNRVALTIISHAPFEAEQCQECHGQVGRFSMSLSGYSGVKSSVCLKCHDGVQNEHAFMHGPVAAVECLACHEPHESRYAHLLTAQAPQLCLKCHVPADLQAAGSPQHADLSNDCLQCHVGHGSDERNLLRARIEPLAPATEPAAQPPVEHENQPAPHSPDVPHSGAGT